MDIFREKAAKTPLRELIAEHSLFSERLPFDEYHLVMAQTDFLEGIHERRAIKQYFYRHAPYSGSYVIFAGLSSLLHKLDSFSYKTLVSYLSASGYDKRFVEYVAGRDKLELEVRSLPENSVAFPEEPIVIVSTNLFDARIIEGLVLSELNFASLSATKWHRIKNAALGRPVLEFGRRRAQNPLKASLYSYIAGVNGTSNCDANYLFGIPSSGTMGHEYVQSFADEFQAFDRWLTHNPLKPCLLIDTINTLQSGVSNASKAFAKHKERLIAAGSWDKIGVRIDSGDLAYLALCCYTKLRRDLATEDISIVLSNDLDEYSIESIFAQIVMAGQGELIGRISFGLGTKGVTGWGEPALGGVCKISQLDDSYILKLSNNNDKITIPGDLRSCVIKDMLGEYITTLIFFQDEDVSQINRFVYPNDDTKFICNDNAFSAIEPRQELVYSSNGVTGEFVGRLPFQTIEEIRCNSSSVLASLDWSYKRTNNPHKAKVSVSPAVYATRWSMIRQGVMSMPKKPLL